MNITILFSDDSTLIFANRIRDILKSKNNNASINLAWYLPENALSYRQLKQLLPAGPNFCISKDEVDSFLEHEGCDAIITSRVYAPIRAKLSSPEYRYRSGRPCIISFLGGLDLSPKRGFKNRIFCDGVYLIPKSALDQYRREISNDSFSWQDVQFGHPSFLLPKKQPSSRLDSQKSIYFFAQALSPSTKAGRLHLLKLMAAVAHNNPERKVFIKLRHLPNENKKHLHKEKHSYQDLYNELKHKPENLLVSNATMEQALDDASLGITCTSTAAIDLVSAGVPCMIYLDYIDYFLDPLNEPMRCFFRDSNLICSLEEIINLQYSKPNQRWMEQTLCGPEITEQIFETIVAFKRRVPQIKSFSDYYN
ncbi:hypothetical protein MXMO3_03622 (plasmid) [Maritalea myrionectae]|uniref:CDP-glycerol glycerophosphotransferase n=1 Tax=Maritalea myrionectae TaxID=454601 RepID=A0A2R4MJH2_9HYPH|nr:DUF6716 putative glycosyltransferase [Maritalea myrionectae]AVX06125.1 hypothetical protein MXMO3_03622 [Maritalea myrionectae]